jgi:thiol-disulfide isomerase/thioredoxin
MLPILISLALGLALTAAVYLWLQARVPVGAKIKISTLEEMETFGIPQFEAENIFGESVNLATKKGRVTIVHFWASWCGPCVDEIPDLLKLARDHKNLALVAVSVDDKREEMQRFLDRYFPSRTAEVEFIWDEGKRISTLYGVNRLPESFIAKPNHLLARKIIGSIEWNTPQALAYLNQLSQLEPEPRD